MLTTLPDLSITEMVWPIAAAILTAEIGVELWMNQYTMSGQGEAVRRLLLSYALNMKIYMN